MKIRLGNVLATAVAVGCGLVALAGYFLPALQPLQSQLLAWGALLAGAAVLIGALNLARVHLRKISARAAGWPYSVFTLLGFAAALGAALAGLLPGQAGGPTANAFIQFVLQNVIGAAGAALAALMAFILVLAGGRLLRRPVTPAAVAFVAAAILALAGMAPALPLLPPAASAGLRDLGAWLNQVWAVAGARGLLLGMALGVTATGLRLLLAVDRPYGD